MRNSFLYGYPVIQSIKSILPLCDEFIAVIGKSSDGTREAVEAIGDPKIRIIDTEWDPQLTQGGRIFAQQANIGLEAVTGDWAFHIQSDEVIHEDDIPEIRAALEDNLHNRDVEGFLFKYLHFVGDYRHIATTRKWHSSEIRILRNDPAFFSYRDSQGFRRYTSGEAYLNDTEKGEKLKVKALKARIFHYSYCRNPCLLTGKVKKFVSYYNTEQASSNDFEEVEQFDFHCMVDILSPFTSTHPVTMQQLIARQDWEFTYDPSRGSFTPRHRLLHEIEKLTGWRIGEYKNYKLVK